MVLLTDYINYTSVVLIDFMAIFADDTKAGNSLISEQDGLNLHQDLRQIASLSDK